MVRAALSTWRSWQDDQARAADTAQSFARVLEEYVVGAVAKIDTVLLAAADEFAPRGAAGGLAAPSFNAFLERQRARLAELLTLRAADDDGISRYAAGADPDAGASVADRDFFVRARDSEAARPVIAGPMSTGIDEIRMIVLAPPLPRSDGAFAAVVYAGMAVDRIVRTFASAEVGRNGSVSPQDASGAVLARYPESDRQADCLTSWHPPRRGKGSGP